ncbi:MAG: hypothetical protein ACOYL3_16180 [Desulfuromonadaceae bacterium]
MKSFSNVLRFKSQGSVNIDMHNGMMVARGNDATGAEFVAARPPKVTKTRRNKALAAMQRNNRKQNRK